MIPPHVYRSLRGAAGMLILPLQTVLAQQTIAIHGDKVVVAEVMAHQVSLTLDHVSLKRALSVLADVAGVRIQYKSDLIAGVHEPVSLHVTHLPLETVLTQMLSSVGLTATPLNAEVILIEPSAMARNHTGGIILGHVMDKTTRTAVTGATVTVDAADDMAESDNEGYYRIANIAAGVHTVTVKRIGYMKGVRRIELPEGETLTLDVMLERTVTALDQVVVTGTVIPTELKAVPSAITVITARQIAERGVTRIDQLFHGDVPGIFAPTLGSGSLLDSVKIYSRGATSFNSGFTTPFKTYIDGVELANSSYLSQIDPKSIERIEILTGPQASTIYGSNAINGVMQIFTKRDASTTPHVTATLSSGFVQNNFSTALTPQHDDAMQLSGREGGFTYNVGGNWRYLGEWTPAKRTTTMGDFGGIRMVVGSLTADASMRHGMTQNRQGGAPGAALIPEYTNGLYKVSSTTGLSAIIRGTASTLTSGLTVHYSPFPWWAHEGSVGSDQLNLELRGMRSGYFAPFDTLLTYGQVHSARTSIRYATTTTVSMTPAARLITTMGADEWENILSTLSMSSSVLTGTLNGTPTIRRQPGRNTGFFVQTQLALHDALFFTYGLRGEWNPAYGAEAQPSWAPRFGVAYSMDMGPVTAKFRGSYGRSTRPPEMSQKNARSAREVGLPDAAIAIWGNYPYYRSNATLGPEHQQGGEGGVEVFFNCGSVIVTRYNQTVDGLIAAPRVDSVQSLQQNPSGCTAQANGYCYAPQLSYLNIGNIRNQGWEVQSTLNVGDLTLRGAYSLAKSRVIGVAAQYRSVLTGPTYHPGGTLYGPAEHTWGVTATYGRSGTLASLTMNGIGQIYQLYDDLFYQGCNSRLDVNKALMQCTLGQRYGISRGHVTADLTASRRLSGQLEGLLQVDNLTNAYYSENFDRAYALIGRQTKAGIRLRW